MVALVATGLTAAFRHDGFRATQFNLNDAGVWVTSQSHGSVGRLNTQISSIEVSLSVASSGIDVVQEGVAVAVIDEVNGTLQSVDVARGVIGEPRELPNRGIVQIGGATGTVVDRAGGRAWLLPAEGMGAFDAESEPTVDLGEDVAVVTGTDGVVHAYAAGEGSLTSLRLDGESSTRDVDAAGDPSITAVGATPVVLDREEGRLLVPGREAIDLAEWGEELVLQQAGPDHDAVLIATDDVLLSVPLDGGEPEVLDDTGTGRATRPVWSEGCAFGAWQALPRYAQVCDGRDPVVASLDGWGTQALVFRVNRKRVVLNDRVTGANVLFTEAEPVLVDDWEDAEQDEQEEEDDTQTVQRQQEACDPASTAEPDAADDGAATRIGRPVVIDVLDNDRSDPCDVLVVEIDPTEVDPEVASVAVVEDGAAIQVSPAPDHEGPIAVQYRVRGANDQEDSARLSVDVRGADVNGAPVAEPDTTVVEAGRSVVHDVLVNDTDPDGDSLTLVGVDVQGGTAEFQANGQIRFTAAGGTVGARTIAYTIRDEAGETADGQLTVQVQPDNINIAPKARNDRLVAFVDRRATLDLLANDTDPNDDVLRVVATDADDSLAPEVSDEGILSVTPSEPGSFTFGYRISDDEAEVEGFVRIDVRAAAENTAPIPVRDDVVARPGTPALVDLVANDLDVEGDLLSVLTATPGADAGLAVELLENRVARVTAGASFLEPAVVPYTVSDGLEEVRGVLVVRPHLQAGLDQSPIAVRDEARLRAGNATSIPVVANDVDPEGAQLVLTEVAPVEDGGNIFVQGDELRFQAFEDARGTYRTSYDVVDAAGNIASGEVVITVDPVDTPNKRPDAPNVEGRVRSGQSVAVTVPLVGLDPDGDPVGIIGVVQPPTHGSVERVADGFVYTADRGYAGPDRFTFTVRDSGGPAGEPLEARGTARIVVVAPTSNNPPVAVPDKVTLSPGEERLIAVLANDTDADDDPLALLADEPGVAEEAREGLFGGHPDAELRVEGDSVLYRAPGGGDDIQDSFTYGVTDGRGGTARGLVTVTVDADGRDPQAPIARDDTTLPVLENTSVVVPVLDNDSDPDDPDPTFRVDVMGFDGATVLDDGQIRVEVGTRSESFIYEITDADDEKAYAVVQIPVVDRLPIVANRDEASVAPGDSVSIPVLANDEPDGLVLERVRSVRGGEAEIDGDEVVFTAADDVATAGGFAYDVADGDNRGVGFVTVLIEGNFPPIVSGTDVVLPAGGRRQVDLQALVEDVDQTEGHEFAVAGAADGIEATESEGVLEISATPQARGAAAQLTVTVTDRGGEEGTATIGVQVTEFEGPPPVAVDDEARTTEGEPLDAIPVTANDVNPGDRPLTVTVEAVQGGSATPSGETGISFRPDDGFFGVALVTYRLADDTGDATRESLAVLRVTVIGIPDPPPAPAGIAESHQVRLTWGVPPNNGAPITGYVVEAEGAGQQESGSNAHVFAGLTNGQPYRFRVAARNEAVTDDSKLEFGAWSAPIVPDQIPDPPAPPTISCANPKQCDTQLPVSWQPPRVDGTPITQYTLRVSPAPVSGSDTQNLPPGQTSHVWTGLANGTRYTFTVRATNEAGDGDWSSSSAAEFPAGQPLAPPSVTAVRNDQDVVVGGLVDVRWDFTDAAHANGSPPTQFSVAALAQGAGTSKTVQVAGNARSTTINGLSNGVDYVFEVWATNRWGEGLKGRSNTERPARTPDAIGSVTATEGDTTSDLTFAVPNDGGEGIDRYEVRSNRGGSWTLRGDQRRITGLANDGQAYTFQVRACSTDGVLGCAGWSPPSNEVRPFGDPQAPPGLTANRNGNTIVWTWNASNGNGRAITEYRLSDAGSGSRGPNDRRFERSGSPGDSFRLCVVAVNEAGRTSGQSCASGSIPRPTGTLTPGGPGSDSGAEGCGTGAGCRWMVLTTNNMPRRNDYTITCHDDSYTYTGTAGDGGAVRTDCLLGRNIGGAVTVRGHGVSVRFYVTADSNGNYSATSVSYP